MGAFPGREFKMAQIIRYINPTPTPKERNAINSAVVRVLQALEDNGTIVITRPVSNGGYATYQWKPIHEHIVTNTKSITIQASTGAPA